MPKFRPRPVRRGFTLIEAALTMIIVGVGVVAALQLLAAGTAANVDGASNTTAINLARNVREMTLDMSFAQVRALNGQTWSPPVDSRGVALAGFGDWQQSVQVQPVSPDYLNLNIVDATPDAIRVTVALRRHGQLIAEIQWYRFRPMP